MPRSSQDQLSARLRALPAAAPLLASLGDLEHVYVVGGAVRDLLLGGAPTDLDLVVEGDPVPVLDRLGGSSVLHDRFGTATVSAGGFSYDIARARRETYPRPGALPEVEPASLEEDLRRRDFTVNAMAIGLGAGHTGELHTVPGAVDDLEARLLRVLHEGSFRDDPTRLLRLVRYQARLRFDISQGTRALAADALQTGALSTVSGSRVGNELRLAASEEDPVAAMGRMAVLGVDRAIHPDFGLSDEELARRAISLLTPDARRERVVLACAGLGIERAELWRLLDELAFEARDRDAIVAAAAGARRAADALSLAGKPSQIAAAVEGGGPELVALAGALGPSEAASRWLQQLRGVRLEIDGNDVVAAGIPAGPAVGRALRAALAAKLDGEARGREQELRAALAAAGERGPL